MRAIYFLMAQLLFLAYWGNFSWAEDSTKRIVFLAGRPSHGYGSHEHLAGCRVLADTIQRGMKGVQCEVYGGGWPEEDSVLDGADAIVMYCDGGGGHPALKHLDRLAGLIDNGVGFTCIHYAVEVPTDRGGPEFLRWLGGYFETHWSVNPHWIANFEKLPDHPVTRGVRPFSANDEWYFHMRFQPELKGVTPILTAIAPEETMRRPDGPHSGNPTVRQEVAAGVPQHTAWTYDRPDGGRSFGFTGGHYHWNWGREEVLRLVCNAILWTAKVDIPEKGLELRSPKVEQLEQQQDEPKPENFSREAIEREFRLSPQANGASPKNNENSSIKLRPAGPNGQLEPVVTSIDTVTLVSTPSNDVRNPQNAIGGLRIHPELQATLSAAEPTLRSLTCLDVDHRGRVWVCEVMNYRGHQGKRPEGDRILILSDQDGDGVMETSQLYFQGNEVDSAMGICVLGNRVIVSASPNIYSFMDDNGDDIPDRRQLLFSRTGQAQHDHSAHSFIFGPDGKLYWNFGNTGKAVHDAHGEPVIDLAGNAVVDNGRPYYGGMIFRCNLDGSQFETIAHNFRNNYEVAIDSFGTLWQSDNDDDGNQSTRINYIMEFGNYGYRDELTGAGWRAPRVNLEATVPEQHWHLNDPGVVPTMLITGAGSPCGITVYEGSLLPNTFRNQVIHCDPGPNALRAYPVQSVGAGYSAKIENMMTAGSDNWFRPVDVCAAPDGSLFAVDWYDPGVGGHQMGDLDRGRLYRLAPASTPYAVLPLELNTAAQATAALTSPNQATRYLAWQKLQQLGIEACPNLLELAQSENPRHRARALWALAKVAASSDQALSLALADQDADVRCMAIRLARQLQRPTASYADRLIRDPSPAVRRELLVALRFDNTQAMPDIWSELAQQYDGQDRWYLEALGIGADRRWTECLTAYIRLCQKLQRQPEFDLMWRARCPEALPYLERALLQSDLTESTMLRTLRTLDYHAAEDRQAVLASLVDQLLNQVPWSPTVQRLVVESAMRLPNSLELSKDQRVQQAVLAQLQTANRDRQAILLKFLSVPDAAERLLQLASYDQLDGASLQAAECLLSNHTAAWKTAIARKDDPAAARLADAIASTKNSTDLLKDLVDDLQLDVPVRVVLAKGLANSTAGARKLFSMARAGTLPAEARLAVGSLLHIHKEESIRQQAIELFPLPKSKSSVPMPPLPELLKRGGDATKGSQVYRTHGTCIKCHQVSGEGKNVGPNLSEIGSKLAKEALYVAILDPSAGISHNFETYIALTPDGKVLSGLLMSQTDEAIVIRDSEAVDHQFKLSELEEFKKVDKSLMPENLMEALTVEELVDLVEYLQSLRKP